MVVAWVRRIDAVVSEMGGADVPLVVLGNFILENQIYEITYFKVVGSSRGHWDVMVT